MSVVVQIQIPAGPETQTGKRWGTPWTEDQLECNCTHVTIISSDFNITCGPVTSSLHHHLSLCSFTKGRTNSAVNTDTSSVTAPSLPSPETLGTSSAPCPSPSTPRCPASSGGTTTRGPPSPTASCLAPSSTPSAPLKISADDPWTTSADPDRWEGDPQTSSEDSSESRVQDPSEPLK